MSSSLSPSSLNIISNSSISSSKHSDYYDSIHYDIPHLNDSEYSVAHLRTQQSEYAIINLNSNIKSKSSLKRNKKKIFILVFFLIGVFILTSVIIAIVLTYTKNTQISTFNSTSFKKQCGFKGQIEIYDGNTKLLVKNLTNFHSDAILFLKYLPNNYVASCSADKTVIVWDPIQWTSLQIYKDHRSEVYTVDQIDLDILVSGSYDGRLHIWKISTGETLKIINVEAWINSVQVLSNGLLVCGLSSPVQNLRVYNYITGNLMQNFEGHDQTQPVLSLELLSEEFLSSGSWDKKVIVWDLATTQVKFNLTGHKGIVTKIKRISSRQFASADFDGEILIWDWLSGKLLHTLLGHSDALESSSLDLFDEETLISGSRDKTVRFWNISNGSLIQTLNFTYSISALLMLGYKRETRLYSD